jgi:hypothetical protein
LVYAIYLGSGIYVTKCNLGLGFLWKLDVVLGLYGLKKLRGEGRSMGSRKRYFNPLETSILSLLKKAIT